MKQALIQIGVVLIRVLQHVRTVRLVVVQYIAVERVEIALILTSANRAYDDIVGNILLSRFWEHVKKVVRRTIRRYVKCGCPPQIPMCYD